MQLAFDIAREAEWFKQAGFIATDILSDQLSNPEHFVPMIGVGDHIAVTVKNIEYGKAIRGKCANTTRGLIFVLWQGAGEAFLAMGKSGHP